MNAPGGLRAGVVATLPELIALRGQVGRSAPVAVTGNAPGLHASGQRSRGMEFTEARPYQSGDDVRCIDWRQTARRGKPYTKLFQEERERPVSLLVDLGPDMRFGTRVAFKSVVAARTAALLAWSAVAAGDRVGGVVWDGAAHHDVRPQSRHHGALALLRQLAEISAIPGGAETALATPLRALKRLLRPGATAVLISDFHALDPESEHAIGGLAACADVALVHVYDVFEAEAPPSGLYRVTDGSRHITLDLRSAAARDHYEAAFAARRLALERLTRHAGLRLLSVATHENPARVPGMRFLHPRTMR